MNTYTQYDFLIYFRIEYHPFKDGKYDKSIVKFECN